MKPKILLCVAFIAAAAVGFAQQAPFTYQGRLIANGTPANGIYDLRFTLHDALSAGTQIGEPVTQRNVAVSNGLFTVTLDFGATAFSDSARWLEIAVRTNATLAQYTTVTPRQAITATPYALHALNADTANTARTATEVTGPVSDARLSPNVAQLSADQIFTGINRFANGMTVGAAELPIDSVLDVEGNMHLNDFELFLRSGTDHNHGLGYFGSNAERPRLYSGLNVDGPVLYGFNGGVLGANSNIVLRWNNAGNVGIGTGTNSPTTKLDVAGTIRATVFQGSGAGLSNLNVSLASAQLSGTYSNSLTFTATNRFTSAITVGANDAPLDSVLDIRGDARLNDFDLYLRSAPDRFHGLGFYNNAKPFAGTHVNGPVLYGFTGGALGTIDNSDSNIVMRWTDAGVGIGTNNPNYRLTVRTAPSNYGLMHTDGTRELGTYVSARGGWLGTRSSDPLHLFVNDGEPSLTIAENGSVGFGTTNPISRLTVQTVPARYGLVHTDGDREIGTYVSTNGGWIGTRSRDPLHLFVNDGSASLTVATNGEVFVSGGLRIDNDDSNTGILSPGLRFGGSGSGEGIASQRTGSLRYELTFYTAFQPRLSIAQDGSIYIPKEVTIGVATLPPIEDTMLTVHGKIVCRDVDQTSDGRLKTNVTSLLRSLEKVERLRGVSYEWRREASASNSDKNPRLGFIAQEVKEVLPEVVQLNKDGYYSVSYQSVVPVLVEALKELRAETNVEIAALKARNESLEKRLAELESHNATLTKTEAALDARLLALEKSLGANTSGLQQAILRSGNLH